MNIAAGGRSWLSVQGLFTLICFLMLVFTQGTVRMIFVFLTVISCLFFLVFLVFFRDPDRRPGSGVVAVADGVIQRVMQGKDDNVGRFIQLCTFMNLYDVHVNRSPFDGVILYILPFPLYNVNIFLGVPSFPINTSP